MLAQALYNLLIFISVFVSHYSVNDEVCVLAFKKYANNIAYLQIK